MSLTLAALLAAADPAAGPAAHPVAAGLASAARHERAHIRTTMTGTSGPLVVLIPGLSTPGAVWDDTVAALKGDHRLLVVEVRGFDGERHVDNAKSGLLDGIVADLAADLHARKLGPALIAGHSMGGLVALKFGLAHPALANKLLVIDALPFVATAFDGNATLATVTPTAAQMRNNMLAQAAMIRGRAARAVTDPPKGRAGAMAMSEADAARVAMWSMTAEPTVVAEAMYEAMTTDLRSGIAGLTMPVTVLYQAAQDPAGATARYRADYAALPSAALVPVDRTSHFIMLDRPEVVRDQLRGLAR